MPGFLSKLSAIFLLLIGYSVGYAQEATTASGGDASGSGGSVAYSVGQIGYTTASGATGSVAQGVQHAYEIYSVGIEEEGWDISLNVYPNPTMDNLTLLIEDLPLTNLSYQLFDVQGKLLQKSEITDSHTQIGLADLPPANYYLNITSENRKVKAFKIIKN